MHLSLSALEPITPPSFKAITRYRNKSACSTQEANVPQLQGELGVSPLFCLKTSPDSSAVRCPRSPACQPRGQMGSGGVRGGKKHLVLVQSPVSWIPVCEGVPPAVTATGLSNRRSQRNQRAEQHVPSSGDLSPCSQSSPDARLHLPVQSFLSTFFLAKQTLAKLQNPRGCKFLHQSLFESISQMSTDCTSPKQRRISTLPRTSL